MKKNMLRTMERLKIDEGIRGLIAQLWKHNYKTYASCEGTGGSHDSVPYVMFDGGDGWFEENADRFNYFKVQPKECCDRQTQEIQEEMIKYGFGNGSKNHNAKSCTQCGAGFNGYTIYRGRA